MDLILIIMILSGAGILNTLYLSYHAVTKTPVKCVGFRSEWCRKVQYSKYSKTLGIPNPYVGLVMYVGIFVLTWMWAGGSVAFTPIGWLIGIGFVFSLYFSAIQALVLKAWCTWCVISAIDFLLLAIVAFLFV